tara:strand:- start:203 stop:871 length:669 start_codon:yes stop_codon:yes gene_type:complete
MSLHLDWATHKAAKYAVEHWHYSKTMPVGKLLKVGVWEDGEYIGVVLFGKGAAPQSHRPYNIGNMEICELVRVALRDHKNAVTRIVAISMKFLKKTSSGIRLIVSYADPLEGHHGGIYQGGNWLYTGKTNPCEKFRSVATGEIIHTKTIRTGRRGYATRLKEQGRITVEKQWKHKYLMPLDKAMRKQIEPLSKPYPKREKQGNEDFQSLPGGATPTLTLQTI